MPTYYAQNTNTEVTAKVCRKISEEVKTPNGVITVMQGSYIIEDQNGNIYAMHPDQFESEYDKSKNKELEKIQKQIANDEAELEEKFTQEAEEAKKAAKTKKKNGK